VNGVNTYQCNCRNNWANPNCQTCPTDVSSGPNCDGAPLTGPNAPSAAGGGGIAVAAGAAGGGVVILVIVILLIVFRERICGAKSAAAVSSRGSSGAGMAAIDLPTHDPVPVATDQKGSSLAAALPPGASEAEPPAIPDFKAEDLEQDQIDRIHTEITAPHVSTGYGALDELKHSIERDHGAADVTAPAAAAVDVDVPTVDESGVVFKVADDSKSDQAHAQQRWRFI